MGSGFIDSFVRRPLGDDPPTARLIYGADVRASLQAMEPSSVHCVVTSPPYWGLRSYLNNDDANKEHEIGSESTLDGFIENLVELFRELKPVLRKDGTVWLNLGDSVTHETPILVREDRVIRSTTVGKFCEERFSRAAGQVVVQPDGAEVLYLTGGVEVLSVGGVRQTGRSERDLLGGVVGEVRWSTVSALIRKPSRKQVVASTLASRTVLTTTDHAFILPSGESSPPERGLRVVTVNGFSTDALYVPHVDVRPAAMTSFYVSSPTISAFLRGDRKSLLEAARLVGGHPHTVRDWQRAGRMSVGTATRLGLLDGSETYTSKTHPTAVVPARLLLDPVFLRFLGLWVGDGSYGRHTVEVSAGQSGTAAEVVRAVGIRFGAEVSEARDGVTLRVTSTVLVGAMRALGFMGDSTTKVVPPWVFNLSRQQIGDFLSGYLFADGHLDGNRVSFTTSSPGLFRHLIDLFFLCGFDIRRVAVPAGRAGFPSSQKSYVGALRSAQASEWLSQFGWCGVPMHAEPTRRLVRPLTRATICECQPVEHDHPYVYDLSVPGTENFVCDGVVLHNSYAGGGRAGKNPEYWQRHTSFGKADPIVRAGGFGLPSAVPDGMKPKDMVGVPWRVAFALQKDGWYLRAACPWIKRNCLSGGTWLYVRSQKGDMPMTVKDLARLDPATVQLWNGERWTQLVDVWEVERPETTYEVEFRSGERVGCTGEHLWPTSRGLVPTSEVRVGDVVQATRLPEPTAPDAPEGLPSAEVGWFVGLYLAEGSLGDHGQVIQIDGHRDEAGTRLPRLRALAERFHGTASCYDKGVNGAVIHVRSNVLISILGLYLAGATARDKHLTTRCWQRDDEFLRALLDGYLEGDGGDERETTGRWRLGFCDNDALARDLRVLSARLGYHIRLKRCTHEGFDKKFPGWRGQLRTLKGPTEKTQFAHTDEGEVVTIRKSRARKFWDLTVADDPHLFALASGILTHNCMPESCTDRPSSAVEYIFLLAHPDSGGRYFYDVHGSRAPLAGGSHLRLNQSTFSAQGGGSKDYGQSGVNTNRSARRGVENLKAKVDAGDATRQKRATDWFFQSLEDILNGNQVLLLNEDDDPLSFVVNPKPYPGAHFAVFPPKLVEPCILLSTSAKGVCSTCGSPWARVVSRQEPESTGAKTGGYPERHDGGTRTRDPSGNGGNVLATRLVGTNQWEPTCECEGGELARPVVLDVFSGSATTGMVALDLGRDYVGLDLNVDYFPLAEARLLGNDAPTLDKTETETGSALDLFGEAK